MTIAAGYFYKDGAYWLQSNGAGPYALDSAGGATPLQVVATIALPAAGYFYKDGYYWSSADGSGPYGVA
jgi:hypothetical protein